ncbi:hypothetical protein [Amycolatopsis sp. 195334CR]|uniref:LNS2 domain-containing protein n=1 Tax=Amycolatopsis sp. 195334CR TaxID=2814588 RepID=UPI001A8C9EFE|nr:hypothetical protein [Amycolatopsis sp. 195334CR]MBN6040055.1 hypothetical protein [Amycolatopsis sp. 195334CR]
MSHGGVAVFDIDGVLADMSAHAGVLRAPGPRRKAWQEFFSHCGDAAVLTTGWHLANAAVEAGFTVVYSTTRPYFAVPATRHWLSEHQFPAGAALFYRDTSAPAAAVIKQAHCRIVNERVRRGYLAAFIDDDPEAVHHLLDRGYAAEHHLRLRGLNTADLRTALIQGPDGFTERRRPHAGRLAHQRAHGGKTADTAGSQLTPRRPHATPTTAPDICERVPAGA